MGLFDSNSLTNKFIRLDHELDHELIFLYFIYIFYYFKTMKFHTVLLCFLQDKSAYLFETLAKTEVKLLDTALFSKQIYYFNQPCENF